MSIWGTLGKIGLGVAAPFTGGLSLAGIPAIGAIEGAQHGGGWAGALKGGAIGGAEALIPYGLSKIPGIENLGGGVIGKMLGKQTPGLGNSAGLPAGAMNATSSGVMGPSMEQLGAYGPLAGGYGAATTAASIPSSLVSDSSGGTGFIQKLLGELTGNKQGMADATKSLGSISDAEAMNRYKKGDMTQGYDRLMLQAQTDRNQNESDAMKKMAQTSYILGGGSQFNPSTIHLNSGTMPDLGFGPKSSTEAQKTGAGTLQAQLLPRLAPGGSYTPTKPDYLNRGTIENIGQYGGLATGLGGVIADLLKNRS